MTDYLAVSRRDVGAGLATGGSALLGAGLVNLWNFFQTFRARGFDSASIAEYRRGSEIFFLGMILAPVIAVIVGTVVWRVMMPDEPDPTYGAVAGVVSALGSLFVFAASIGFMFSLSQVFAGALAGAIFEFLFLTVLTAVFGGAITAPVITPLGALGGYVYERYITDDQR
ncbi:hypothetical protein [Haloarcula sp. 1CSR25-25]|jgi:hypothetical protein|uniref:hypothetical protein n=1 Tax=Haloarcula sp. 1CSR25-25 TaxID=2862545 RepID=UPI002894BC5C|nr:hypothetical protein [Haloarcula sp. 1CSR25-25]MDT3437942.1 hypothetical protein [Haloarcula sp. 1CSR25-25]